MFDSIIPGLNKSRLFAILSITATICVLLQTGKDQHTTATSKGAQCFRNPLTILVTSKSRSCETKSEVSQEAEQLPGFSTKSQNPHRDQMINDIC